MESTHADAIRLRRLELGWSQEELADKAGIASRTVQRIEAGAGGGPGSLGRLLKALDLPLDGLKKETLPDREKEMEDTMEERREAQGPVTADAIDARPEKPMLRVTYYKYPYHDLIPYDVPMGAPIPRVGEFVVLFKPLYSQGESPVQTYKVVRVLYAHDIYTDTRVRAQIDIAPVTSFNDEVA